MTKDIINVIQIDEELDAEYEAAKVLRKYPKDTVMLNNIKGYDIEQSNSCKQVYRLGGWIR